MSYRIDRAFISTSQPRPKPRAGDIRTTKKNGTQIRVQMVAKDSQGRPIGRMISGGRPVFEWVSIDNLADWDRHLIPAGVLVAAVLK